MGQKNSRGEKTSNHVAFPDGRNHNLPNITLTTPTPLAPPDSPSPFAPPPTPRGYHSVNGISHNYFEETPILDHVTSMSRKPPPPPSFPPPRLEDVKMKDLQEYHDFNTVKRFGTDLLERNVSPLPPPPQVSTPIIKQKIFYAKDRIAMFEGLNTVDRHTRSTKTHKEQDEDDLYSMRLPKPYYNYDNPEQEEAPSQSVADRYPVYNAVGDYSYKAGMTYQSGSFPIDVNRTNIGICGRSGSGKSSLINALRGVHNGNPQSAGRFACDRMEPFRFIEGEFQSIVLWEIPYPRSFSNVTDVFDANRGFDKFYENHKLNLFRRLFVLIPDGSVSDEDLTFARVAHSRRTSVTFLMTKSDDDLDAESRESARQIDARMKRRYKTAATEIFARTLQQKAQVLLPLRLLLISCEVVRNLLSGTIGYLHYLLDEEILIELLDLPIGCHAELEIILRKERDIELSRPNAIDIENYRIDNQKLPKQYQEAEKSTVLADAGFEIMFGTDDRVYGSLEPKTTVVRAGKTTFNYGFLGCRGVGKSAMINAMRGMSSKHPLAAGKGSSNPGHCEKFEFEDNVLKYNVALWEYQYPKRINTFFEFIDHNNIPSLTALFILVNRYPTDADLAFAKIAMRKNTSVLFLVSKCDKMLSSRSRDDEIPVCDLLKQRFIDKALDRFEKVLSASAPELCGRVHVFFVSAPVFRALRNGDSRGTQFVLHERAVFDFLKSRRIIADMLDTPVQLKEGLYANVNLETAGTM